MSVVTQEYQNLIDRQEAIKQDMLGVAAAIEKLDNGFGKKLISYIGSMAANSVGIPIQIPTQFAYATLGVFGIIPTIRDTNKLKKYVARIKELESEYNDIAIKLLELDSNVMYDTPMNPSKKTVSNFIQSENSNRIYFFMIVLVVGMVIYFLVRNK